MTMRLVCDHCNGVINDAEFVELRVSTMTRNADDPLSGTGRSADETEHYHKVCREARERAAVQAPMSAAPPPPDLPDDHPLRVIERRSAENRDEQIRTEINVGEQERRGALEAKTVDELEKLAREQNIDGRSQMNKDMLVDALLKTGL